MTLPSVLEIEEDLKMVRTGLGLNYQSAKKFKHVTRLPAVDTVLKHSGRSESDRFAIALELIECVAGSPHLIGDRNSEIALMSLNIKPRREDLFLEARENVYRAEKHLSEKAFKPMREVAFSQLAGYLVPLTHSPCAIDADAAEAENTRAINAWLARLDPGIRGELETQSLRAVHSDSEHTRKDALRKFIELVPGYANHVQATADEPIEALQKMFRRVLDTEYPKWTAVLDDDKSFRSVRQLQAVVDHIGSPAAGSSTKKFIYGKARYDFKELAAFKPLGTQTVDVRDLKDPLPEEAIVRPIQKKRDTPNAFGSRKGLRIPRLDYTESFRLILQIIHTVEAFGAWSWVPSPDTADVSGIAPVTVV
ncbi:hypothetical protein [Leucobacter aridicollis]|uniref:hypothetical protein n=1 Tax=Leucobacter aridicollis TaxID=283878 RepID=UPI0021678689|nr:hypothetical protein [Leucobacter aridicollis]MCS3427109.1 hypothetical protein [Leucobacter aridicollis]